METETEIRKQYRLDFAIAAGMEHGEYGTTGRRSEDRMRLTNPTYYFAAEFAEVGG